MIKANLIKEMKGSQRYVILNVVWQWIALISQIFAAVSISVLIAGMYLKDVVLEKVWITLIIVGISIGVKILCEKFSATFAYKASYDVKNRLRKSIYDKIISLGTSYRETASTSELIQLSVEGIEQLEIYYSRYLPQFIYSILAPITLFFVIGSMSWKVAGVLLICVPLIPLSIVVVQKIAKRLLSKYWGIYTGLGDTFLENIQGLTTLKIYKSDEYAAEEMDKEAEKFRRITMKVLTMQLNSISVMDLIAYGGAAIGIVLAVIGYRNNTLELWQCLSVILLAAEFFIPLRLLGSFFHIAMNGMAASDKIFKFLETKAETEKNVNISEEDVEIEFKNVTFSYDKNDRNKARPTIKNVNLKVDKRSFISIVGASGSGKSTIAALIAGKYSDFKGDILVNGNRIDMIDEKSLNRLIVTVKYNSYMFTGTVEENLKMAKEDATDEEMISVLEKVNLWKFLESEKGLKTTLEEQGNNLSGGQKQRLALARAILKNAGMYIFDEASSNIDVESEETIMNVIKSMAQNKTVILISHRMANVVTSDNIYLMNQGEVIESGNHEELMKLGGKYHELFTTQEDLGKEFKKNSDIWKKDRDIEHEDEDERGRGHEA